MSRSEKNYNLLNGKGSAQCADFTNITVSKTGTTLGSGHKAPERKPVIALRMAKERVPPMFLFSHIAPTGPLEARNDVGPQARVPKKLNRFFRPHCADRPV